MLDLLAEVKGDQASESLSNGKANGQSPLQPSQHPVDSDRLTGNEPLARDLSGSRPPSSGLFSKYRGRNNAKQSTPRGHEESYHGEADHNRRRSSGHDEFSPLGSQMKSLNLDNAQEQTVDMERSPSQASSKDLTFLEKVKLYRKRRKSLARSSDGLSMGPLEEGAITDKRRSGDANRSSDEGISRRRSPQQQDELRKFFDLVSESKALLAKVVQQQKQVQLERENMRILVHPNDIQSAQEAIQDKVSATTAICKQVKTILDKIDDMYAQSLDSEEVVESDETLKLHLSVMAGLNAKASEVIKSWQKMQTEWNAQDLEDVGNKLHIVTGQHFSDDEVQNVLDNGSSDQLYKQALQDNISGVHVQKALKDVQERHEQVRQLETSMAELHQTFLDLSILVADQGATVDTISNWVDNTAMTMQSSLIQLHAAKRHRRAAAQKKAATFVTGVGLVAGGVGLTATGVGAVAGVPMMVAGVAAVGASGIGGMT